MNLTTQQKALNEYNIFTFVKEKVKIEDVAKRLGLKLEKSGESYQGNCPTGHPSNGGKCFSLETENQYYRCFNCQVAGDAISLVELVKKLSPMEAVDWLIKEYGLSDQLNKQVINFRKLSPEKKTEIDNQRLNSKLYQAAFEWMKPMLFDKVAEDELNYLTEGRKYDIEILKNSNWCYFPPTKEIRDYLISHFPEEKERINKLSLHGFTGERIHLAIPYYNSDGLITGFLKRAIVPEGICFVNSKGEEKKEVRWDSTEGIKKTDLFNLFSCKGQDDLLIVEGYPDAVILSTMGLKYIVAVGQGNLSQSHLEAMKRFKVKNVTISFDNDKSGPKNTETALNMLLEKSDITPYVLEPELLAPHKDPDEFVKAKGLDAFNELLNKIELGVYWLCKRKTADLDKMNPIAKQRALNECVDLSLKTNNPVHESEVVKFIMEKFKLKEKDITKLIKQRDEENFVNAYKKIEYKEDDRYFPFIEQGTSAFAYFDSLKDNVYLGVGKDILRTILASAGQKLPDPLSVLTAVFDVHNNKRIDLEKEILNFFVPSEYMLYSKTNEIINPRKDFYSIYRLLTNLIPRYQERKLFINWLAGILQTREKLQTAWVFKGEQGAGKGLLLTHVLKKLFGRRQAIQVEDAQLKSEFNPWLQNSMLIAFNEVARDNSSRNAINSRLKAIITDKEISINDKNIRTFYIDNYVNCLFFSNESVPIFIEQKDRRYNVIETADNLNKNDWFENNPDEFIDQLESEVPKFAQFLMNWKFDSLKAKRVFENDAKETMVSSGMNRFEEFTYKLKTTDIEWFEDHANTNSVFNKFNLETEIKGKKVPKDKLLELFLSIYDDTKINPSSFGKKMVEHGIKSLRTSVPGNVNIKATYYVWD